jgi:hypothetical protein
MEVALYIKTLKFQNTNALTLTNFVNRVEADGGTFEAGSCLKSTIESLGGTFGTEETYNRIELFEDEKISVTSSIQNVNDISKVFTDYSQSFTIPASANNNEIFRHWYENSLDNGFDQRIRYDGYIEIDTQTFRSGKWQLESATVKNNRVEDYKITFYGELKSLMDKFGDDKLKDVETLNNYTFAYSGAAVKNKIQSATDENVMFPLITSDRVWESTGVTDRNIFSVAGAILHTDLFPAIKISKVVEAIESKYNLNFSGSFLTDERFTKAYIWFKNNEARTFNFISIPNRVTLTNNQNEWFNIANNSIQIVKFFDGAAQLYNAQFFLNITFSGSTTSVIKVYKDGVLFTSVSNTGTTNTFTINQSMGLGNYYFEVQTSSSVTYSYTYNAKRYSYSSGGGTTEITFITGSGSSSASPNIDLTNTAPDIKVSDFFSGVLKMFNLTAFSEDGVNFTLEQLENWYYLGQIRDYSGYTTTDITFDRIKPYKKIDFQYQKSESLMNSKFYDIFNREYGNLNYGFPNNDGQDYVVNLPFENMLFSSFPLNVGYALKPDFVPYKPKPIVMYYNGLYNRGIYFNDGSTTANLVTVNFFSSDMEDTSDNNEKNTLNWGVENSSFYNVVIDNTLFANYYLAYLNNLYSLKSRLVKVKMRLPYLEMLNLKLNDRIVIRDKRYIINSFTTDLITFESDFELIQDFRSIDFDNSTLRITDNQQKDIKIPTTTTTDLNWTVDYDDDGLITTLIDNETYLTIQVKQNVSGLQRNAGIISDKGDLIIIIQDA